MRNPVLIGLVWIFIFECLKYIVESLELKIEKKYSSALQDIVLLGFGLAF